MIAPSDTSCVCGCAKSQHPLCGCETSGCFCRGYDSAYKYDLAKRVRDAHGWMFSIDDDSMSVSVARDVIRQRFGEDVDEELRRRYA